MARSYLIKVDLNRLASSLSRKVAERLWTEQEAEGWLRESGLVATSGGWLCECRPSELFDRDQYAIVDCYA
jgi:hypothetical protein